MTVVHDHLAALLGKNRELHIYELGDLDPFFFPRTRWFVRDQAVCLLYTGSFGSTLLAFSEKATDAAMRSLLDEHSSEFPPRFYTHLTPGLSNSMRRRFDFDPAEPAYKMVLGDSNALSSVDTSEVIAVSPNDLESVETLYREAYPGNWFDARMLDTGCYCGIREPASSRWLAIAGVHVYSPEYRVAALGNIVARKEVRGRGLGSKVTAALCKKLLREVDVIGLNVMSDNAAALACYRKLGFEVIADYEERGAREKIDA